MLPAKTESGDAVVEEALPLARIRELLQQLKDDKEAEVGWELGLQVDVLAETYKESSARLRGLEEENRQLQERLARGQEENVALREPLDELLNLNEMFEAISSSFKIEDILIALMDLSRRIIDYESCGVFSCEEEDGELEPMALRGREDLLRERVENQRQEGVIHWVLREQRRPVVIDDMETVDRDGGEERNFVIIPLSVRGKQIGIYVLHCRKQDFTAGEIDMLGVLANQTAVAIENARLYTDIAHAHEQLQESQRQLLISAKQAAIGELAGGVAHEVNNPLQIILSRVQLMYVQQRGNEKVMDGLQLIESNVKRISRIIRALLGFARNSSDVEWGAFNVVLALQQACALVKHQLDSRLIEVSLDCGEDIPEMVGNIGELEQVFINLIINAQNAMPKGGRLDISAHRHGETAELRFTDTGVGIAAEYLDRIFEPFFTTRADEGGTGLGLAVSYRIIELHQGTLTVESMPGEGTSFIIRLPLRPQQPQN